MKKWLPSLFRVKRIPSGAADAVQSGKEDQPFERLNTLVYQAGVRQFGPFFADKVMNRIKGRRQTESEFFETFFRMFRRIAVAGVLTVVLLCTYNMLVSDSLTTANLLALPQWSLEEVMAPSYTDLLEASL